MTLDEAKSQLTAALAKARPDCFVQVSPQALALVLAQLNQQGDEDEQPTVQQ